MTICVEYPQGSGGTWLSHVIYCIINQAEFSKQSVNWHDTNTVPSFHDVLVEDISDANIISITSSNAKFNFWSNYVYKRINYELESRQYKNILLPVDPYSSNSTAEQDFEWICNQCKFIINYQSDYTNIEYIDLFTNTSQACDILNHFLASLNLPTCSYTEFEVYVEVYRQSVKPINLSIKNDYFYVWAIAICEFYDRIPSFNIFDNIGEPIYKEWIQDNLDFVMDKTKELTYLL